jgi:hypothetical protein
VDLRVVRADDRPFDRTGDDLALGMEAHRVVEDLRDNEGPILHGAEHVSFLRKVVILRQV